MFSCFKTKDRLVVHDCDSKKDDSVIEKSENVKKGISAI